MERIVVEILVAQEHDLMIVHGLLKFSPALFRQPAQIAGLHVSADNWTDGFHFDGAHDVPRRQPAYAVALPSLNLLSVFALEQRLNMAGRLSVPLRGMNYNDTHLDTRRNALQDRTGQEKITWPGLHGGRGASVD